MYNYNVKFLQNVKPGDKVSVFFSAYLNIDTVNRYRGTFTVNRVTNIFIELEDGRKFLKKTGREMKAAKCEQVLWSNDVIKICE